MSVENDSLQETIMSRYKARIISKADEDFIIGGYANVYMLDEDGNIVPDFDDDVITLEALDEGIKTMMAEPSRRNHMYYHTNMQIGEIVEEHTDSDGVTWKTHVVYEPDEQYDKKGLFIVCKIFHDNPLSVEVMNVMGEGHMLAFSVGGLPLEQKKICDDDKCWNEISKFYLAEVSSCERGINAESKGFIIKFDKDTQYYYHRVDSSSNGYIVETVKNNVDEDLSSTTGSNVEINQPDEDSDFKQKEENTLTDEPIQEEECPCEEPVEEETPVEKKIEPVEEPVEEEDIVEKSDEPNRKDFDTPAEFFKAYTAYFEKMKETQPITEKQLDEKLEAFKDELLKAIGEKTSEEVIGEVVKKSMKVPKNQDNLVDTAKWTKKAFGGAPSMVPMEKVK